MRYFQQLKMTTPINVNSASTDDHMSLQGVGGVTALKIIKKREECGGCLTPDHIKSIPKICATTWQPWFKEAHISFASPARSHESSHISSASKLSERGEENFIKETEAEVERKFTAKLEAEVERKFNAKLEAETNRLIAQMEAQI